VICPFLPVIIKPVSFHLPKKWAAYAVTKPISRFLVVFASWVKAVKSAFDVRDFLVFGGMFSLGYGLYTLYPWLGFSAFGLTSMLLGLGWLTRRPGK